MKNKTTIAPNIYMVEAFLTLEECNDYIKFAKDNGFSQATIQTSQGLVVNNSIRNNSRFSYDNHDLSQKLFEKMKLYLPETFLNRKICGLNNRVYFYKYDVGQKFDWHKDGHYSPDAYTTSYFTFLVYLNDNFEGGSTSFDSVSIDDGYSNFTIEPKVGTALFFYHKVRHRGDEVRKGIKYVMRSDVMYGSGLSH